MCWLYSIQISHLDIKACIVINAKKELLHFLQDKFRNYQASPKDRNIPYTQYVFCWLFEKHFLACFFFYYSNSQWEHLVLLYWINMPKQKTKPKKSFLRATAGYKMVSNIKVTNHITCFHLPFCMLCNKYFDKTIICSKKKQNSASTIDWLTYSLLFCSSLSRFS